MLELGFFVALVLLGALIRPQKDKRIDDIGAAQHNGYRGSWRSDRIKYSNKGIDHD